MIANTEKTFRDKWEYNRSHMIEGTLRENSDLFLWMLERNGFKDEAEFAQYLGTKKRILDAGCGNGRMTTILRKYSLWSTEIVGIDLISPEIAEGNLLEYFLSFNVRILKKDILGDLSNLGKFDFIYCQEVLHHISNPEQAFRNLCGLLLHKGEIAIYVYKQKSPIREFIDDYIRKKISGLSYEEAIRVCDQITEFGKILSQYGITIKIPPIDILDIKEGEYDLQRFIYHFFMKCFWNPNLTFQENSVTNYDWYHPQIATRHTLEEVRRWFERAELEIVHESIDLYGITVRGKK